MGVVAQIKERRFYPRVVCHIKDSAGETIRNISQSGIYLESDRNYQRTDAISLSLLLPPEQRASTLVMKIVRRETLSGGRYGYGLSFKDLDADDFKRIQYFILYYTTRDDSSFPVDETKSRVLYKTLSIQTHQQNLTYLDPRLAEHIRPTDCFAVYDLTRDLQQFVRASEIKDGTLVAQILHTSATLAVNELDEPMLLMDLLKKLRSFVPKDADYFHNGPLRQANLCVDDSHCDRNGDAHVKAALFGQPSVTLIVRNGELMLGHWQKVALLEFDGPRRREVVVQVGGYN